MSLISKRQRWSTLEIGEVKRLVIRGETSASIAQILTQQFEREVTVRAVENIKNSHRILSHCLPIDLGIKIYQEITLPLDNYIIGCDAHAPYFNELWVNRMLAVAEKYKIKKKIHVGDLLDLDFAKHYYDEEASTLDEEILHSSPLFNALDYFDKIYLVRGNHEKRIGVSTDNRVQAKHLFGLYGEKVWNSKIVYSVFDKVKVGDDWILIHPQSYSQVSGSVAVRLAEKFHRHVLNAHGHFFSLRYDRSGKYMGIDIGGLFEPSKVKYIQETTTTHPRWNQGFAMIYNNKFYGFHKESDWDNII